MAITIQASEQPAIVAGDVKTLMLRPTLDGNPIDAGTEIKLLAFVTVSGAEEVIIPTITATYSAANTAWVAVFPAEQTRNFLTDPNNPLSALKAKKATLVVQVGAEGSLGTLFYDNLVVRKGYII